MKYSEGHEWIDVEGKTATVGITNYAQKELGEIVYIELPEVGREVKSQEEVVVIESTKAASDIYSPVSGTILCVNDQIKNQPHLLNEDPENAGWLFKMILSKPEELDTLLEHQQYLKLIS